MTAVKRSPIAGAVSCRSKVPKSGLFDFAQGWRRKILHQRPLIGRTIY